MSIVGPYGTLLINQDLGDGTIYRLNPKKCVGRRGIRVTTDPIPQGDGEIFHDRFATGSEVQLCFQLWNGEEIACDDPLVEMYDDLRGQLWSLLRPRTGGGRVIWTPSGQSARMLDNARLKELNDPEEDQDTGATEVTAVIDSPFPYAISLAQDLVTISGSGTITNNGNVEFWPVIKLYSDGGVITNNELGLSLTIEAGCLGGGTYIELDTFRNTAYVDGDQANAKPCLAVLVSDFFPILPGANEITASQPCDFLMNDAYA